jgi:hypothetical protein
VSEAARSNSARRLREASELVQQIRPRARVEVVVLQRSLPGELVEELQAGFATFRHRDRHGAVSLTLPTASPRARAFLRRVKGGDANLQNVGSTLGQRERKVARRPTRHETGSHALRRVPNGYAQQSFTHTRAFRKLERDRCARFWSKRSARAG